MKPKSATKKMAAKQHVSEEKEKDQSANFTTPKAKSNANTTLISPKNVTSPQTNIIPGRVVQGVKSGDEFNVLESFRFSSKPGIHFL